MQKPCPIEKGPKKRRWAPPQVSELRAGSAEAGFSPVNIQAFQSS